MFFKTPCLYLSRGQLYSTSEGWLPITGNHLLHVYNGFTELPSPALEGSVTSKGPVMIPCGAEDSPSSSGQLLLSKPLA